MKTRSASKNVTRSNHKTEPSSKMRRSRRPCQRMVVVKKQNEIRKSSRIKSLEQILSTNKSKTTTNARTRSALSSRMSKSAPPLEKKSPIKKQSKQRVPSGVCNFCLTSQTDNHLLGELKTLDDITAHRFCLYFSPGLSQNGEPNEGLWGFLPDDIRKELKRGVLLKCSYCGKKGAVVGCSIAECIITFHLTCGMENGAFFHYHQEQGLFPSYCTEHRPKLIVPTLKKRILCTICQEYMKNSDRDNLLFIKCCHSYFHRECLVNVAHHQGEYNLKCPNCNNKDEFVSTIKNGGIFVPPREPTWEITGEVTLNHVQYQCSAPICECQQGRTFNGDDEWELFSCDRCGSNAIHVQCAGLTMAVPSSNANNDGTTANSSEGDNLEWFCDVCRDMG